MNIAFEIKRVAINYQPYFTARRFYHALLQCFLPDGPYPAEFVERKVIFIHIPKSAGNAVTDAIFGKPSEQLGAHRTARSFKRYDPKLFNASFKFSFTRDPVDRFASAYFYLKTGGMNRQDHEWSSVFLRDVPDIHEFVRRMKGWYYRSEVMSSTHFQPQLYFVGDRSGKIMVDHVGKYENLASEFSSLAATLGVRDRLELINPTNDPFRTRDILSREEQDFIRELYKSDVAKLGYG